MGYESLWDTRGDRTRRLAYDPHFKTGQFFAGG